MSVDERQVIERLLAVYQQARKSAPAAGLKSVAYWTGFEQAVREIAAMMGVDELTAPLYDSVRVFKLTAREREIAQLIVEGLTGKRIAERLCITYETYRTHRQHIGKKLGIVKRAELVGALTQGDRA